MRKILFKKPHSSKPPKEVKRHKKPGPDSPYEIISETRKLVRALGSQSNQQVSQQLDRLLKQGELIMATLAEVKAAIAQVATDIVAEKAEVQTALAALKTEIQALKDQIAAGSAVTAADLDELITSVNAIDTGVKDISEPSVPV